MLSWLLLLGGCHNVYNNNKKYSGKYCSVLLMVHINEIDEIKVIWWCVVHIFTALYIYIHFNQFHASYIGNSHYKSLLSLTLGCRHSRQIFPELTTCLTESVFVPYRFCSNSPDSMNFPAASSDSKLCRDTKLYSLPLSSCVRGFRVVSVQNHI